MKLFTIILLLSITSCAAIDKASTHMAEVVDKECSKTSVSIRQLFIDEVNSKAKQGKIRIDCNYTLSK